MKLKIHQGSGNVHQDLVAAVGWNVFNELYSCSDDKSVARWDMNGEAGGKVRASFTRPDQAPSRTSKVDGGMWGLAV